MPKKNPEQIIGSIRFSLESLLKPWDIDPERYLITIDGKIVVSKDDDSELAAGEIRLVNIKIAEAKAAGVNLHHVFDSYSSDLEAAYHALFDSRERIRRRHKIVREINDVLFMDAIKWKRGRGSKQLLAQAVETALAAFGQDALVCAYATELNQFGLRWQLHGFQSAGTSGLLLRDNLDFPPEEMATWVLQPEHLDETRKIDYPKLADD